MSIMSKDVLILLLFMEFKGVLSIQASASASVFGDPSGGFARMSLESGEQQTSYSSKR